MTHSLHTSQCQEFRSVLLVDDDLAILRLLARWLDKAGYQVQTATNGREAVEAIENECPRFLITDWEMPEISGPELCRQIRRLQLPHYIYVVFVTGRSSSEEIVEGFRVGADDFLHKPVRQTELLARLHAGQRVLALEHRLRQLARTDSLTGLLTQRSLYEILQREFQRSQRHHLPVSCVMVDLDFFKRINDVHGHPAGDTVLRSVANLLCHSSRSSDVVARYGGEEFCVLLPETTEEDAVTWGERFRKRLAETSIDIGEEVLHITCSVGAAGLYDDTLTAEMLLDQADQALLCAKRSGRDRVVGYQSLNENAELDLSDPQAFGHLFQGITAEQVMTPVVAPMRDHTPIGNAADYFLRSRITSTPIVDAQGRLVGILSEKDLMAALVSLDSWSEPVSTLMRPQVVSYSAETPIRTIYEFMCRVAMRRIIIVRDGKPIGAISRGTLLRWFRNMVAASGILDSENEQGEPQNASVLSQVSEALVRHAQQLHGELQREGDDLIASVVGVSSQMQELLIELLAFSREGANDRASSALGASMLAQGTSTD